MSSEPDDRFADVHVDADKAREHYREWLAKSRSAERVSPDGNRRPHCLLRPGKPARKAYRLSGRRNGDSDT